MSLAEGLSALRQLPIGNTTALFLFLLGSWVGYTLLSTIHNIYFGPLAKYPGPKIRALSTLPKALTLLRGTEATEYVKLHDRYGPVVRVGPNELSYIGTGQIFKDVHGARKSGEQLPFKDPKMVPPPLTGVDSMLTADDANHVRHRRIMSPAFADRGLKDLEPMLIEWINKLIDKLGSVADAGKKADMVMYYNCTTFDIMADMSFGASLGMLEAEEYSLWVKSIFQSLRALTPIRALRCFSATTRYLVDNVLLKSKAVRAKGHKHYGHSAERVDKRLASKPARADLWTKIIDKSAADPEPFTRAEHHVSGALMMGAGSETSATALSGITYFLLRNPSKLARLTQEIRSAFTSINDLSLDPLRRLPYLQAVINEGLRMYPPVPIALHRVIPAGGALIAGDHLPAGTTVGIHHLATYRSSLRWTRPYEFVPERFEKDAPEEFRHDDLSSFEPFSIGPRGCIGKNLALHEIRLILAATLLSFDLELCEESRKWTEQKTWVLWDKSALFCRLRKVEASR
ncbi:cytochrome P450 [Dissoconium aciculare CBS 342.82]|uniref:Cytochrome P450 n=1 Tax=Dissoconium aciculare CBS 342.82 TaxID=1314786 RepID=A0A6J3M1E4_9PEZI|nr:cytochrome P450 [Dissoconium aciculare CBS 342.82]KAF1821708.1 cytochrome P450 [Dissoconium aciculare CBS 342.82]